MKRVVGLLLALVLTLGCLGGLTFAAEPLAAVKNGDTEVTVSTAEEIKALINPDGTTVVTMLRDYEAEEFLVGVPTFTLDMGGHKMNITKGLFMAVSTVGTKNHISTLKNGIIYSYDHALEVHEGAARMENVIGGSYGAPLGLFQDKGDWNADNVVTNCTLYSEVWAALVYNLSGDMSDVQLSVDNSTLISCKEKGSDVVTKRTVGGMLMLGENVEIYTKKTGGWVNADVEVGGSRAQYMGPEFSVSVPELGLEMTKMGYWSTSPKQEPWKDKVIAHVIHDGLTTEVTSLDQIAILIDPDGTTVVKMMDDLMVSTNVLYGVPTFTLDLNGHTVGSNSKTAIGVTSLGTENTTTVIKNGTLIGGQNSSVAVNVKYGGMRLENLILTANNNNAVVGVYQLSGEWNADNLITGCTIVGAESSALAFNSTTDPQTEVSITIENSVLFSARDSNGTYPINQRQVPGGTVILGKSVDFYAVQDLGWLHPELKHEGEVVTFVDNKGALDIPEAQTLVDGLYHWQTPRGTFASSFDGEFADVAEAFWGYDAIMKAAKAGLVKGKAAAEDGTMLYAPNDTMTRAEFITTVLRLFYADEAAAAAAGAKWWTGYYDLAKAKGIVKDGELGGGDLDKPMTREEMALVLSRTAPTLAAYKNVTIAGAAAIPDYASVANANKDAVLWVYAAGLIQGMDDKGSFAPQGSLTRAQSATVLAKLVKAADVVEPVRVTVENETALAVRQEAIRDTAMAYYYKNPYMQYDWNAFSKAGSLYGRRMHYGDRATPEYASEDMTVYGVCAAWANVVSQQTFGYTIMGSLEASVTKNLSAITKEEAGVTFVYQRDNTGNADEDNKAAQEVLAMLQNGDVVTYTRTNGQGHTVIYIDDVTGDGKADVIHTSGGRYNHDTGLDSKEVAGILLNTDKMPSAEAFLFDESSSEYLGAMTRYSVVRPAALDPKEYPLTESAKTRTVYDGLAIFMTTEEVSYYGTVEKGTELTYKVTLTNNSTTDYKELAVQIPCPENALITKLNGTPYSASRVTRKVSVPAGQSVSFTFTVKATGSVGSVIKTEGGYVMGIRLPVLQTVIGAYTPNAYSLQSAAVRQAAAKAATNADFAEAYYKAALGKDISLPEPAALLETLFSKGTYHPSCYSLKTPATAEEKAMAKLMVPDFYGGWIIAEEHLTTRRILETRTDYLQAGDVIYVMQSQKDQNTHEAWVFDGKQLYTLENGEVQTRGLLDIMALISYDFFVLLRPSQIG